MVDWLGAVTGATTPLGLPLKTCDSVSLGSAFPSSRTMVSQIGHDKFLTTTREQIDGEQPALVGAQDGSRTNVAA